MVFPVAPADNDLHTENGVPYKYDLASTQWRLDQGPVIIAAVAPIEPRNGELWHDSTNAHTFVWRNDITAWVMIS